MKNQQSETTQTTPFYANIGFHPRRIPETLETSDVLENAEDNDHATRLQEIQFMVQAEMLYAQSKHQEFADQSRTPAPQ